jgi:Domain of unknown function (DUF4328)
MALDAHPGARFERQLADARLRAIGAIAALGLTVASRLFTLVVEARQVVLVREAMADGDVDPETMELGDRLAWFGHMSQAVLFVVTAVLFIQWLWIVIGLTRDLGGRLWWRPRDALRVFLVPIVNFWEPYRLLRDVTRALAPQRLPDPPTRMELDGSTGYRDGRLIVPPPRRALPAALVGAWWTAYSLGWVPGAIVRTASLGEECAAYEPRLLTEIASDAAEIVAAVLAIQLVRAVAARLDERFRRIRHNPVDVLDEAGIRLPVQRPGSGG